MSQEILNALAQLDVNDDDQWTEQGMPRLDAVRGLAGDPDITRAAITKAAPGFSRDNAVVPSEAGDMNPEPEAEPEETEEAPEGVEEVRVAFEAAKERVAAAKKALNEAKDELVEATAEYDELAEQYNKFFPPESLGDAIQNYLKRQKEQLAERAKILQQAREQGRVDTRAPIDRDAANKPRNR